MLHFSYVLVCVLLIAGSKEQPSISNFTTLAPTSYPIITIVCDPISDRSCHTINSSSLESIAEEAMALRLSIIYINITISQLNINAVLNFSQLKALTISGDVEESTNITCTRNNAGFVLHRIDEITLNNMRIIHCGAVIHNYTTEYYVQLCHHTIAWWIC